MVRSTGTTATCPKWPPEGSDARVRSCASFCSGIEFAHSWAKDGKSDRIRDIQLLVGWRDGLQGAGLPVCRDWLHHSTYTCVLPSLPTMVYLWPHKPPLTGLH